jgi:hypothetical protein
VPSRVVERRRPTGHMKTHATGGLPNLHYTRNQPLGQPAPQKRANGSVLSPERWPLNFPLPCSKRNPLRGQRPPMPFFRRAIPQYQVGFWDSVHGIKGAGRSRTCDHPTRGLEQPGSVSLRASARCLPAKCNYFRIKHLAFIVLFLEKL